MEDVFRALSDPSRRALLDSLRLRDGQALAELETLLPGMTRFGVMKHLRILEQAGLVTTRRDGRRKLHFLNPVPIRLIHDRWISRYAEPIVGELAHLKRTLEAPPTMAELKHVYEVYIRTTPERLWQALTDPNETVRYYYRAAIESSWAPGAPLNYVRGNGELMIEGELLTIEPGRSFSHSFHFPGYEEKPSRVTYRIDQLGDACRLTVTHDDFEGETVTYTGTAVGWNPILSGLKTLLETGRTLDIDFPEPEPVEV
jgi:DNA-binding transcriptional ArsR family regulator/uncharacterized protein YndB with AHSA1/START domain